MIWTIQDISGFLQVMTPAGEPDQGTIDAYLRQTRRQLHPQKHVGVRRYYYLLDDDARISLGCVGTPLEDWRGAAWAKVGTNEIIGEFARNRHLAGHKGLRLQLSPMAWLKEPADQDFATAQHVLENLSTQILDLEEIERSQKRLQRVYRWEKAR